MHEMTLINNVTKKGIDIIELDLVTTVGIQIITIPTFYKARTIFNSPIKKKRIYTCTR